MIEKWLEMLLSLTNEYQMTLQLTGLLIQSISQLVEQKNLTLKLKRQSPIVEGNYFNFDSINLEFLDGFPNVIEKCVYRQMVATQQLKLDLEEGMNSLGSIVDQMIDIQRQISIKGRFERESDSPVSISVTQASLWIEHQLAGYQVDLIKKEILYESLDFSSGNHASITSRWNILDDIDLKEQVTIQERLKVWKNMGQL
jgi:hypothetical protein